MRKVKYRVFIPQKYELVDGGCKRQLIPGTGVYNQFEGVFHQWASGLEEVVGNGVGMFTYGIVESSDGAIHEVLPADIQFVEPTIL